MFLWLFLKSIGDIAEDNMRTFIRVAAVWAIFIKVKQKMSHAVRCELDLHYAMHCHDCCHTAEL
jgi:hypothetical protein